MKKNNIELMSKISDRALSEITGDKLTLMMDIECVHKSTPLDLERLLNADDFNFFHDIFGIQANLNRKTEQLENFFLPRFCQR